MASLSQYLKSSIHDESCEPQISGGWVICVACSGVSGVSHQCSACWRYLDNMSDGNGSDN